MQEPIQLLQPIHPYQAQASTADLNIAIWRLQIAIAFKVPTDSTKCLLPPVVPPSEDDQYIYEDVLSVLHFPAPSGGSYFRGWELFFQGPL